MKSYIVYKYFYVAPEYEIGPRPKNAVGALRVRIVEVLLSAPVFLQYFFRAYRCVLLLKVCIVVYIEVPVQ